MKKDEEGEIINDEETYREIAGLISKNVPILIGWTDEEGSHYDILFVYRAMPHGENIQGGIRALGALFVSIMRKGAFGFNARDTFELSPTYIAEKLTISNDSTAKKVADLISGIRKHL